MPQAIPFAIAALQTAGAAIAGTFGAAATGASLTAAAASTLGAAGISGIAATAAGVAGGAIAGLSLSAGISLLSKPKVPTAGAQISAKKSAIANRTVCMGRSAYGGYIITDPMISGKKNAISSYVVALSGAGENGTLEKIIYGGQDVYFDANGRAIGKYAGAIWCIQKSGTWTQTAININGVGGLESTAQPSDWGVNDRLLGCAHVMVVFGTQNEPVKSEGAKEIKFVWVADKVALTDPRTGAAATTLAQRKNPFVWAYSWAMLFASAPSGYAMAGLEIPSAQVHQASAAYCANYADTNGFTIAGELSLDPNAAIENLKAICQAGGGAFTIRNGQLYFTCAAASSIVGTLTDDDFTSLPSMRSLVPAHERKNTITPRFRNEANGFEVVDGSAITSSAFLTADNNNERADVLELPYCGNGAAQAGKLAALALVNAREPNQYNLPLKPQVRYIGSVGDTLQLNCTKLGWTGQKIIIAERTNHPDLNSDVTAISETDTKYAWALGQSTTPPDYSQNTRGDSQYAPLPDVGTWTSTAVLITDGTTSLPIIRLTGASDFPQASNIIAQIRLASGGSYLDRVVLPPSATQCEFRGLTPNTSYVVGVSYINQYGFEGAVRELSAVNTGKLVAGDSAKIGGLDAIDVNNAYSFVGANLVPLGHFETTDINSLAWFRAEWGGSVGSTANAIIGSNGSGGKALYLPNIASDGYAWGSPTFRLQPSTKYKFRVRVWTYDGGSASGGFIARLNYKSTYASKIGGFLSGDITAREGLTDLLGIDTVISSTPTDYMGEFTTAAECVWCSLALYNWTTSDRSFAVDYIEILPLSPAEEGADVTGSNVAAAISGQGTGATANNLTQLNTSEGTKLGGIAAGATVGATTGTNLVSPTYGVLPDSAIKTDLGVAAAITNQGTQAIANHQRGATYSGTPTEGSWWSDTTTSKLKLYTGGAWVIVADIGGIVSARIGTRLDFTNTINSSSWVSLTSPSQISLSDCPTGRTELAGLINGIQTASGTGTCDINLRALINGSVIYTGTSQPAMSGGIPIAVDFQDVIAALDGVAVPSGTNTFEIQAQRTSGTGSVTSWTGGFNIKVIAT